MAGAPTGLECEMAEAKGLIDAVSAKASDMAGAVEHAAESVRDQAREAKESVATVGNSLDRAVRKSLNEQPMTTVLMAAAIGFVVGALWKS
jgi:ElaB/YqjD/DUF883 family membrane-anchored ribosome-binding protein